ncbi:ABC transporter ATP-binding protein [Veillonella sp. R32]|uniref:ABC transporter ATP-binding protein n=1 Tax=Veillonella sp. R32 TaxID=2021312 RepID=UPI00138A6ABE|nr:ABC transporter ATP-binding protein [Veillonella sp. R32]KAF1681774.1 iron ABC transporter ATP-binding protein [Veillonella sp. R32]
MTRTLIMDNGRIGYQTRAVGEGVSLRFDRSEIVSIIGPNGSGKSTVLKTLGRLLEPLGGTVYLDGKDIQRMNSKAVARIISMLPQSAQAPVDMTVRDLVLCGRLPYQNPFSALTTADVTAVQTALEETSLVDFQHRPLKDLSGGERQRAWLAMAVTQEPDILLLDEPTTFLDVRYQLELMKLVVKLHETRGITVIMVLHDLNHAARFSHRLIAVKQGQIVADGPAAEIFTEPVLSELYDVNMVFTDLQIDGEVHTICVPYESR